LLDIGYPKFNHKSLVELHMKAYFSENLLNA
jgi:hypothetical protein